MKKILSFVLVATLVLSLMAGCGRNNDDFGTPDPEQPVVETNKPNNENKPGEDTPGENKPGEETPGESKPGENKPEGNSGNVAPSNPNLVKGDDLEWPQDKMGSLKPLANGKLYSINPDDLSCTVGFENVEAKDAEEYFENLKATYSNVLMQQNEAGVILFMAQGEEGTVSFTYDYKDKFAVVALSYPIM